MLHFAQISETVILVNGVDSINSFNADASVRFVILESATINTLLLTFLPQTMLPQELHKAVIYR